MSSSNRTTRLAAAALAVTAAGGAMAAAALRPQTPRAHLTTDVDAPLFAAADLVPGDTRTACLTVGNSGDAAGRPALYVPNLRGELARYLALTVTRGTNCAAFTPDAARFGGAQPGVVFEGRLSDFPSRLDRALLDPEQWRPGDRHAYRFTLALGDEPQAAGLSASWDWRLAVDALPAPRPTAPAAAADSRRAVPAAAPAAGCQTVRVAGAGVGTTRRLTKTVALNRRVRAELVLRAYTGGGATRVTATTGLRVRGKTLLIPGWAKVRYRLNGSQTDASRRRPFRVRIAAGAFRPGPNRVSVAVQKRRSALKRLAAFTITVTPTTVGGKTTCVLSA